MREGPCSFTRLIVRSPLAKASMLTCNVSLKLQRASSPTACKLFPWFRGLPKEPVVRWTAACLSAEHPHASAFVDIEVPPLLHHLEAEEGPEAGIGKPQRLPPSVDEGMNPRR